MSSNLKICVLCSGGLDSALLLYQAMKSGAQVYPLYITSGFYWESEEQICLEQLLKKLSSPQLQTLKVLSVPLKELFPGHWGFHPKKTPNLLAPDVQVYLPARNLTLLSQALLYSGAFDLNEIWMGTLAGNPFLDGQEDFFRLFETMATKSLERPIQIKAPFIHLKKSDLLLQYPDFPYELTLTCLKPQNGIHCGGCNKCEERRRHFKAAGIQDRTQYAL